MGEASEVHHFLLTPLDCDQAARLAAKCEDRQAMSISERLNLLSHLCDDDMIHQPHCPASNRERSDALQKAVLGRG